VDGFFNVFKPVGWTSFDVIAALRGPLRQKRLGHGGTLDPAATGVLPLAAGYATRLLEYLVASDKEYIAEVELGRTTDTYDSTGEELSRGDWSHLTQAEVESFLDGFRGVITQTPPAYSAVKVSGQPAYKRVRRGEKVELRAREVTIHELELLSFEPPTVRLRVVCSKGTYLRSLANDLGHSLGPGAFLAALERTRVGPFLLKDSVPVENLRSSATDGTASSYILSSDTVMRDIDAAILSTKSAAAVANGRPVRLDPANQPSGRRDLPLGTTCRAYSSEGALLCVLKYVELPALWKPSRVFPGAEIEFK
jgi:tRNA pseudouridine55 synthase